MAMCKPAKRGLRKQGSNSMESPSPWHDSMGALLPEPGRAGLRNNSDAILNLAGADSGSSSIKEDI